MSAQAPRRPKDRSPGTIRPYEPQDRDAVREICCRTAFRNLGSDALFEDREIHADYWTSYYTDHYPEDSLVIEQDGAVIGYFFGCPDHARFVRTMARRIVPWCLSRMLWRLGTGQYKRPETRRYIWHTIRHGAAEAPPIDYKKYPATYHCNILRQGYGRCYYTQLTLDYLDQLEARGIDRVHGHVTEPVDKGGMWHKMGDLFQDRRAEVHTERSNRMFQAVTGDPTPMVNRVYGVKLDDYRQWMLWLRENYRL